MPLDPVRYPWRAHRIAAPRYSCALHRWHSPLSPAGIRRTAPSMRTAAGPLRPRGMRAPTSTRTPVLPPALWYPMTRGSGCCQAPGRVRTPA
eukprot:1488414-Pleurochrysis_carterae.AAC.1